MARCSRRPGERKHGFSYSFPIDEKKTKASHLRKQYQSMFNGTLEGGSLIHDGLMVAPAGNSRGW
jgi:hypothetical protein